MSRRRILLTTLAALMAASVPAFAFWSLSSGSSSANFGAADISVTSASASVISSTEIDVAWVAPGTNPTGTQYKVVRDGSTTVCTAATSPCQDTGLLAGSSHTYTVAAVLGTNWQSTAVSAGASKTTPSAPQLSSITASTTPITTGATESWTVVFSQPVSGVSTSNFAVTNTTGSAAATLASATATGSTPATTWTVTSNAVTGTGGIRLDLANKNNIADSGGTGLSDSPPVSGGAPSTVTVNAVTATHAFTISGLPNPATAGAVNTSVTITALNNGATNTSYSGTKTLDWAGSQTIGSFADALPMSADFTNGVATVSVTLYKAGTRTLAVTDHNDGTYSGATPAITVNAATPILSFSACTNGALSVKKNSAVTTAVTRTGTDQYGNSTGTGGLSVNLSPNGSPNASFTTASVLFTAGALTTGNVTYNTANGNGTNTITGSAPGYTSASCVVTTTN